MAPTESMRRIREFNPLNHKNLLILKSKIPNVINDDNLKAIIKKYENCQSHEITEKLQSVESLKPVTIHRIRDYINRKNRKYKPSSDHNSFTSDYSTPHSNSSTSSCAIETQELKQKIATFWSYTNFQRSLCEILNNHDDLNLLSKSSIEINYKTLKPNCRNDIINLINNFSPKVSQPDRQKELIELYEKINLIWSSESNKMHIYSLLKNDKSVSVDKSGLVTFNLVSLSSETISELTQLVDFFVSKMPSASKTNLTDSCETEQISFDMSRLPELTKRIKVLVQSGSNVDKLMEIIAQNESLSNQTKLNFKKFSSTTLFHVEKYINSL